MGRRGWKDSLVIGGAGPGATVFCDLGHLHVFGGQMQVIMSPKDSLLGTKESRSHQHTSKTSTGSFPGPGFCLLALGKPI